MHAEVLELDAGARHQVLNGARDQHIVGVAELRHPRRDVYRDPTHVVLEQLDFAGMKADPHRNVEPAQRGANGAGAMDRPGRPVEGGQETVTEGLHLSSAEPRKLAAHRLVVRVEQIAPTLVARRLRTFGRIDNVLKDHSREYSIDRRSRSRPRQKLLDLREHLVVGVVVEKEEMICPRKLDQSGTRNARGQFAAAFHADQSVLCPMEDQRWDFME